MEILERKCSKLRSRAEQEEKGRRAASEELEELRPRFEELQREVLELREANEKLAEAILSPRKAIFIIFDPFSPCVRVVFEGFGGSRDV